MIEIVRGENSLREGMGSQRKDLLSARNAAQYNTRLRCSLIERFSETHTGYRAAQGPTSHRKRILVQHSCLPTGVLTECCGFVPDQGTSRNKKEQLYKDERDVNISSRTVPEKRSYTFLSIAARNTGQKEILEFFCQATRHTGRSSHMLFTEDLLREGVVGWRFHF
jgi:hypothetical protein